MEITLYHYSYEEIGFEITDTGLFGGIFASQYGGMYGQYMHVIKIDSERVLTHDAFRHLAYAQIEEREHKQYQIAVGVLKKYVDANHVDALWELVAEERFDDSQAAELLGMADEAEAGWSLRARVSRGRM